MSRNNFGQKRSQSCAKVAAATVKTDDGNHTPDMQVSQWNRCRCRRRHRHRRR